MSDASNKYRTIVADPPWRTHRGTPVNWVNGGPTRPMPYSMLSVDEIAALPVGDLAMPDAHLYLWTINAHLTAAYDVARAWGFRVSQVLVWAKAPRGLGPPGPYASTVEFILFCRRGSLTPTARLNTTWWGWKRPEDGTGPCHSRKPDGFLDVVEQVSPGPYVELFARRARFGWDYYGDESLGTAEMPEPVA